MEIIYWWNGQDFASVLLTKEVFDLSLSMFGSTKKEKVRDGKLGGGQKGWKCRANCRHSLDKEWMLQVRAGSMNRLVNRLFHVIIIDDVWMCSI